MTAAEKRYPDWVQEQRTRGTTVKKKGDTYYLYKRTSRRVPGKKYPQPVDTYIGIITQEGVIKSGKKNIPGRDRSEGIRIFPGSMAALPPGVEKAPGRRLGGCPFHHPVEVVAGNLPYERKEAEAGTGFPLSV